MWHLLTPTLILVDTHIDTFCNMLNPTSAVEGKHIVGALQCIVLVAKTRLNIKFALSSLFSLLARKRDPFGPCLCSQRAVKGMVPLVPPNFEGFLH